MNPLVLSSGVGRCKYGGLGLGLGGGGGVGNKWKFVVGPLEWERRDFPGDFSRRLFFLFFVSKFVRLKWRGYHYIIRAVASLPTYLHRGVVVVVYLGILEMARAGGILSGPDN